MLAYAWEADLGHGLRVERPISDAVVQWPLGPGTVGVAKQLDARIPTPHTCSRSMHKRLIQQTQELIRKFSIDECIN